MAVYRYIVLTLAAVVLAVALGAAVVARRIDRSEMLEWLGLDPTPPDVPRGPILWIALSGARDLAAAKALVDTVLRRDERAHVVVTAPSPDTRQALLGWRLERVRVRIAPLDYRWALGRFLAQHQPAALIALGGQWWPNRMALLTQRRVPVAMVGARLPVPAGLILARAPRLARTILAPVRLLAPASAADAVRITGLRLPHGAIRAAIDLTGFHDQAATPDEQLRPLAAALPYPETILAMHVAPAEEATVLSAFAGAAAANPHLRLILVPQDLSRADAIEHLASAAGMALRRFGAGKLPFAIAPALLVDRPVDPVLWHQLAAITFVGGTLSGDSPAFPILALRFGSAILHGPETGALAPEFAALDAAGAARVVTDAASLRQAMLDLTDAPEICADLADRADAVLAGMEAGAAGPGQILSEVSEMIGYPGLAGVPDPSQQPRETARANKT